MSNPTNSSLPHSCLGAQHTSALYCITTRHNKGTSGDSWRVAWHPVNPSSPEEGHGDCDAVPQACTTPQESKGCNTARGGGNASETSAEIVQISACRKTHVQSHLACLPCLPALSARHATPTLSCGAHSANDCVNGSLITATAKRRYTSGLHALGRPSRESDNTPARQRNRLVMMVPLDFSPLVIAFRAELEGNKKIPQYCLLSGA